MEKITTWTVIRAEFESAPEDWAVPIEIYREHGIEGTLQEDRPPALVGYAHHSSDPAQLVSALRDFGAANVSVSTIEEENWAETWKQFFKPVRIGEHFVIRPTWEPFEAKETDRVIVLDPGQAFGTGDHPTTRMCLELMEMTPMEGLSVADIGCGSGILSVAARMLGAGSVVAVDSDPPSIESTTENLERNQTEATVFQGLGFSPLGEESYDIVVSNIISATLIRLAPDAAARVKTGGAWIVSGIIQSNWPDVLKAAQSAGFELELERAEGEWVAARFRRLAH